MAASDEPGEIITFYSYKGGTGRTMALANTACLLARRQASDKGVLMVDWDLEAPGLHHYFKDYCRNWSGAEDGSGGQALDTAPGLIDLFRHLDEVSLQAGTKDTGEDLSPEIIERLDIDRFIVETDIPSLHLLKAGCFTGDYSSRVNRFNWEALLQRSPSLIRCLAERLTDEYRYVLLDSRTGLTDTSGICSVLMPEKLVVVFTPNRQSLTGVVDLVRRAIRFRRESDDLRPLLVFPLPSRVEQARPKLRDGWRFGETGLTGYQPQFEALLAEVYDLGACSMGVYFDEVQIQQAPDYAYGEEIAALVERSRDRLSLVRGYEIFLRWLEHSSGPWDTSDASMEPPTDEEWASIAEATFASFAADEQEIARRVLVQLVHVVPSPEEGEDRLRKVAARNLGPSASSIPRNLIDMRILVEGDADGEKTLELASPALLHEWGRLKRWIQEDRDFLLWRQRLREKYSEWERIGRDKGALLVGALLTEARKWLAKRGVDLLEDERKFISASIWRHRRWELGVIMVAGLVTMLLVALLLKSCPAA